MNFVGVMLFTQQFFSFRMFIFLLTRFDTWDCYYFRLNLSQVLLIQVLFIKKICKMFLSLLKMNFVTWVCFCVYLVFQWGCIVRSLAKRVSGLKKIEKVKDGHIGEGGIYRRRIQNFTTLKTFLSVSCLP